jgi:hypothetical protein
MSCHTVSQRQQNRQLLTQQQLLTHQHGGWERSPQSVQHTDRERETLIAIMQIGPADTDQREVEHPLAEPNHFIAVRNGFEPEGPAFVNKPAGKNGTGKVMYLFFGCSLIFFQSTEPG